MTPTRAVVYVVDDDTSAREGVASLIRSAGLTAKTFTSAEEFLAAPRPRIPSCLVLDVTLPDQPDSLTAVREKAAVVRPGQKVEIVVLRGGRVLTLTSTIPARQ